MSDSPAHFDKVRAFAVPAIVSAFFFQPDIAALGTLERTILWILAMAAMAGITYAFDLFSVSWRRSLALALVGLLFTQGWYEVQRDHALSGAANDRRCLAIQRDMLSARPRRLDSPDLFQALGCRPQGQGSVYAPPPVVAAPPTVAR